MEHIILNGENLNIEKVIELVKTDSKKIKIAESALDNVNKSHLFLMEEIKTKIIYGVNTGFGPMASKVIPSNDISKLQVNLIRSHAVGVGNYIDRRYVLAAMIIRLNSLVKGHSGVSVELVNRLAMFINHRIYPLIPEHGAVGTSGDLVQLAHIALAIIGEGMVYYNGNERPCADVLTELSISQYQLKPKEGLALINGTSVMTAISTILCYEAGILINAEIKNSALALELSEGHKDSLAPELHAMRPHYGQVFVAESLRNFLADSKRLKNRKDTAINKDVSVNISELARPVQEVYSLRCTPQILGPIYDTLRRVSQEVEVELNSVTDNPVIVLNSREILHGGNFHGDYIANAIDSLKIVLVKLSILSERRVNYFLNSSVNKFFPPFLNINKPGLTLGLQGLQFVATSTTSQNQTLAYPQYVHSIPTNGDNQDVVSMGTDAALLAAKVLDNSFIVAAIEAVVLAQAVDCLAANSALDFSQNSRTWYGTVRSVFPVVIEDRPLLEVQQVIDIFHKQSPL